MKRCLLSDNYLKRINAIISFFLMLTAFTSRLSVSVKSVSLVTALLLIFLTMDYRRLLKTYQENSVARAALLLYLCFLIGMIYSIAPTSEQWHILKIYSPLLWIAPLIVFFQTAPKSWDILSKISACFIYGAMLAALLGTLNAYHIVNVWEIFHPHTIQQDPAEYPFGTFSFSISFAAYLSAQKIRQANKTHYHYLVCFLFLSFFILFISHQRTAYILYAFLFLLFGYQKWHFKGVAAMLITLALLGLSAYHYSTTFHYRVNTAIQGIEDYNDGNPISSPGLRLLFLKDSYHLWQQKPLLGYGTGSFKPIFLTLDTYNAMGQKNTAQAPLDQPHNDYAYIAVQLGLFGLLFFSYLLFCQLRFSFYLPPFEKHCAQALILGFILSALDTTLLFYSTSATDFMLWSALLFANRPSSGNVSHET